MIVVTNPVPRSLNTPTTKTLWCRGWKCPVEVTAAGKTPAAAKRAAVKLLAEHEADCEFIAASRAEQLALQETRAAQGFPV